jgi:hypothetical protein
VPVIGISTVAPDETLAGLKICCRSWSRLAASGAGCGGAARAVIEQRKRATRAIQTVDFIDSPFLNTTRICTKEG